MRVTQRRLRTLRPRSSGAPGPRMHRWALPWSRCGRRGMRSSWMHLIERRRGSGARFQAGPQLRGAFDDCRRFRLVQAIEHTPLHGGAGMRGKARLVAQ